MERIYSDNASRHKRKEFFFPGPVDGGDDTGGVILIALKFFKRG
jgi:hypothetical protein